MIEVFKTNVKHQSTADSIVAQITRNFSDYVANFDLDDCDLILRIENPRGLVCASNILSLLERNGCWGEVLADTVEHTLQLWPALPADR